MAIPEERLARVKAYCGEEEPDATQLLNLTGAYEAAVAYLKGAGVAEPPAAPRLNLWLDVVLALTLDNYDQRGMQFEGPGLTENRAFRRKLNQLKQTEPPAVKGESAE